MSKEETRSVKWGKRLLVTGVALLAAGIVLLMLAPPFFAVWALLLSVLVNAAGGYLLVFGRKKG
ncbi:hypothetical protein [Acetanaerobacterium elongatum]|uniref:Uncharacterized protein n=1 Tax=Acetanaerobacterium elongatum TaxID=258515 RepID=A0A1G9XDM1_9FIRM|nr:hypothetical protein [Acetanaerobacterium elongatum]SDM94413.1 hypothetical protein SAMN05192585_10830 [Acetanaerobacterium elongatum]